MLLNLLWWQHLALRPKARCVMTISSSRHPEADMFTLLLFLPVQNTATKLYKKQVALLSQRGRTMLRVC